MVESEQNNNSPHKALRESTKDNVMHLVEQRGCECYELLPGGVTITTDIYCQKLRRLADAI